MTKSERKSAKQFRQNRKNARGKKMGIVKGVLSNGDYIAIVTNIGAIPFEDEGEHNTQSLIDDFNKGVHTNKDDRWYVLSDDELKEYSDVSDQYWL